MHDVWSFIVNRRRALRIHEYRAKQLNAEYSILWYRLVCFLRDEDLPRSGPQARGSLSRQGNRGRLLRGRNTSDTLDLYNDPVMRKNQFDRPSTGDIRARQKELRWDR